MSTPSHPPPVTIVAASEARRLVDNGALVLDTRDRVRRLLAPIRGAVPLPWTATRTGGVRSGLLPQDAAMANILEDAGVGWKRPVVVVCRGATGWGEGARVAWTLAWLGHPHVVWWPLGAEGRAGVSAAQGPIDRRTPWPGRRVASVRTAPDGVSLPTGATVLDVRTPAEHAGARKYGEVRGGCIPGAVRLPLDELWDAGGLHDAGRARLSEAAEGPGPVVCVCTGGVRSAAVTVLLWSMGVSQARNHDGGMWAWSADPSRPMEP